MFRRSKNVLPPDLRNRDDATVLMQALDVVEQPMYSPCKTFVLIQSALYTRGII